jgi:GNAT superfamily N-acetyltransferase
MERRARRDPQLTAAVPTEELLFRGGGPRDMRAVFDLAQLALRQVRARMGPLPDSQSPPDLDRHWERRRSLFEFVTAQDGFFFVCEARDGIVGFARGVRLDGMEQLTELFVHPDYQGRGIGRGLLERCWPEPPTAELGRVVVATGAPADLTLYTGFGAMPVNGRLRMVERTGRYVERRLRERDVAEPGVHVLEPARALAEWRRMEHQAIGHERRPLQEFLARERTCLACVDPDGSASSLCWVSPDGDLGPGVAATPADLVPVVLAALDRVAKAHEPEELQLPVVASSWGLLRRLRTLGFRVSWPGWMLCSVPLPELSRYLPMDPGLFL